MAKSIDKADEPDGEKTPRRDNARKLNLGPLSSFPGYMIRRIQLQIYGTLYDVLAPFSIRPTQAAILILLKYNPGVRSSDIADTLGLKRPNFLLLLDELSGRGLAERRVGIGDRRAHALHLTVAGMKFAVEVEIALQRCEHQFLAAIDPDHIGILEQMVKRLTLLRVENQPTDRSVASSPPAPPASQLSVPRRRSLPKR